MDLLLVQQQLALAVGVAVEDAAVGEGQDVHAVEPRLAAPDEHEGVGDLAVALAQAAHLGAREHQARFKRLVDEVLVRRGAVLCDLLGLAALALLE